jgi:hypothetical protein
MAQPTIAMPEPMRMPERLRQVAAIAERRKQYCQERDVDRPLFAGEA